MNEHAAPHVSDAAYTYRSTSSRADAVIAPPRSLVEPYQVVGDQDPVDLRWIPCLEETMQAHRHRARG